jgi:hypothetical protein
MKLCESTAMTTLTPTPALAQKAMVMVAAHCKGRSHERP